MTCLTLYEYSSLQFGRRKRGKSRQHTENEPSSAMRPSATFVPAPHVHHRYGRSLMYSDSCAPLRFWSANVSRSAFILRTSSAPPDETWSRSSNGAGSGPGPGGTGKGPGGSWGSGNHGSPGGGHGGGQSMTGPSTMSPGSKMIGGSQQHVRR